MLNVYDRLSLLTFDRLEKAGKDKCGGIAALCGAYFEHSEGARSEIVAGPSHD